MNTLITYILLSCFAATHIHGAASSKFPAALGSEHEIAESTPNTIPTSPLMGRSLIYSERAIPKSSNLFITNGRMSIPNEAFVRVAQKSIGEAALEAHKKALPLAIALGICHDDNTGLLVVPFDLCSLLRTYGPQEIDSFSTAEKTRQSIIAAFEKYTNDKGSPTLIDCALIGLDNNQWGNIVIDLPEGRSKTTLSLLLEFALRNDRVTLKTLGFSIAYLVLSSAGKDTHKMSREAIFWLERYCMEDAKDKDALIILEELYEKIGDKKSSKDASRRLKEAN